MVYSLTGGDFNQIDFIMKNWTIINLHKWIGIREYIIKKQSKK